MGQMMNPEPGVCPKCGREIEDYGCCEPQDGQLFYPFTCKCGFSGREWYDLDYVGFTDCEGNEVN